MPSKNSRKVFVTESFYHVYNRGVEKRQIFLDNEDYSYFLFLFKRHLSKIKYLDSSQRPYVKYHEQIELVAFCLMPNHFHILLYLMEDERSISKMMISVCTAYTMYFNKKYKRVGPLFQGRFKASRIDSDRYLDHISRYIHLNPREYKKYQWSSLPYYHGNFEADWVKPQKILALFNSISEYMNFVSDYEAQKKIMDELKYELADH